ncbi:DNA polymerase/3'-5' exonuclease PolX [soil metagenome]
MDKKTVSAILDEIGTLLELQGENPFRCNAYHSASRAIDQMDDDLALVVAEKRLATIKGIGATLQDKIITLVTTGELPFYTDLKPKIPPGMLDMLRLPGMGPKKIRVLADELKVTDLVLLKSACEAGTVAALKGFGAKTQQKILEGLAFLEKVGQRVRIDEAMAIAESLRAGIADAPGVEKIELCGSLRRRKETIQDIDLLVAAHDAGPIMDRFVGLPGVVQIVGRGDTKASVMVERISGGTQSFMQADLRVVSPEQFPFALHYFTGSKEHNVAIRGLAQKAGLKLNEYELAGAEKSVACKDEAALFGALGLDFIPPEMREDTGEVEAAGKHQLPVLIEHSDLRGTFHCHTNWSDGTGTVQQMAEAAHALGFKYLGIGDHSQSLTVANGLTPERVKKQHAEIDAVNAGMKGFKIFKGTECDILSDGQLDFDDATLATFDYVVASVHSHFNQTEAEMTARLLRAVRHPAVRMLGHATGRLLLRRDGYRVDMEAVLRAAAECGTMVEINAHPQRLDIDWITCKRARSLGVMLVINPDAHSTDGIGLTTFGIDVARRAWLTKNDVFNTQTAAQVAAVFKAPKKPFAR